MATSTLAFSDLADSANKFMTGQAIAPYLANLPNYANMVGSRTENITQQLKGQLPQDVINQIGQQAAERGVSSGSPGSPNANSAYLRALGLNSLQMQQQGNQNLSGAIADTPVPRAVQSHVAGRAPDERRPGDERRPAGPLRVTTQERLGRADRQRGLHAQPFTRARKPI